MVDRHPIRYFAFSIALIMSAALVPNAASGQYVAPRTADGHPDLQGNWSNATVTPVQRPEGEEPVLTWEEVAEREQWDGVCPPNPGTVECGRAPREGTSDVAILGGNEYNEVYWDRGTRVAVVNGEPRSSLITRPNNGRRSPLNAEGQAREDERRAFLAQFGESDNPENRVLQDRCLVSFGHHGGPPMTPNYGYNNNYTIVQTSDYVMLLTEMVHDARIIRLGEPARLPDHITPWFGDSRGHWEGETLVGETTNMNPIQTYMGVAPTPELTVHERFTRVAEDQVLYEFTVDDPSTYAEPWGGEVPFWRFDDLLYEYNCHEGNYAMPAILSGARYEEQQAAENNN